MNIIRNNRGATLVFVALSTFLLLLFLGVATDAGWTVYVRSQGQARVDAAALAAARALVDQNPTNRQTKATTLANTFSDKNSVVNASTDPANVVDPMKYNLTTGALTNLGSDWTPGAVGDNCNAVRVATAVPTPLFFSGVRNVFGASETGSMNINVNAVAHLPCPGSLTTDMAARLAPLALRQCRFSTASDCEGNKTLWQQPTGPDNSAWTLFNLKANGSNCKDVADGPPYPSGLDPEVKVGETIDINNGQIDSCLKELEDYYTARGCTTTNKCGDPPDPQCTAVVPIIDACSGGKTAKVTGFATICFTDFKSKSSPKYVKGSLECNEYPSGTSGAGGVCLGSYTRNPILVR